MANSIYLDHAATTFVRPEVIDTMHTLMREEYGNASSIHSQGRSARSKVESARKKIAKIINASVGELFFTSTATEANNMIIQRAVIDLGVDLIISSPTEHHCVLYAIARVAKENNVKVVNLKVDQNGDVDPEEIQIIAKANPDKKIMVSLMNGNNELGNMHPVSAISAICKEMDILFHCDAVQAMGKYHIDVQRTYYSFLTASSHKFHGPKGVGFVYINNGNIISPFIVGGAQERNMRAGTENVYGIVGMADALSMMVDERDIIVNHLSEIQSYFESKLLQAIPTCTINAQGAHARMAHITSVSFPPGPKADMLMFNLDINGFCASSGSACSAGIEEDSHVLIAIDHPSDRKTIRFSFSYLTTTSEIDSLIEALGRMI